MQVHPYLNFNGQCEEAFTFYAECLGGELQPMHRFGETDASGHVAPEWSNKIMHASLVMDGTVLMGSDDPTGNYATPRGMYVSLHMKETADADRVFAALAENGNVVMQVQETFWAARFGMVVDRFGTPWMINCERTA